MISTSIITLGCKLNQVESESLADSLQRAGYPLVSSREKADVYLISCCTVTSKAEQKARRLIRSLRKQNPGALIIITSCYAQLEREKILSLAPNLFCISLDDKSKLLKLPDFYDSLGPDKSNIMAEFDIFLKEQGDFGRFAFNPQYFSRHSRAFLKIQDGCSNHCTYCRVRLARGKSISLPFSEVLERAQKLEQAGYREIVLTGVNISQYRGGLPPLLEALCSCLKKCRLRLSSLEPEAINKDWVPVLQNPCLMPHFHLPLQSGSNRILKAMGRKYNTDQIYALCRLLRQAKKDPFIAADIIVGFPTEDQDDFNQSLELLENLNFSRVHVFRYSARPDTAALNLRPLVPEKTKQERSAKVLEFSKKAEADYYQKQIGSQTGAIVIEGPAKDGFWQVLSDNYLDLKLYQAPAELKKGDLIKIKIIEYQGNPAAGFLARVE